MPTPACFSRWNRGMRLRNFFNLSRMTKEFLRLPAVTPTPNASTRLVNLMPNWLRLATMLSPGRPLPRT